MITARLEEPIDFDKKRVEQDKLLTYVNKLSRELSPRGWLHYSNLWAVSEYIYDIFKKYCNNARFQEYKVNGVVYRNVIASFLPERKGRIVIGAHYDAFNGTPGADDNASGVAGILELVRLVGEDDCFPVDIVAWCLEEPPFFRSEYMGSAIYVRELKEKQISIELAIVLEMIGYISPEARQTFPYSLLKLFYPSTGDFIAVVGRYKDRKYVNLLKKALRPCIKTYSLCAPVFIPGIDFSDHLNFWNNNYNAVMITDTAFYRNFSYHCDDDIPEKLNYEAMVKIVEGVYLFLYEWFKGQSFNSL